MKREEVTELVSEFLTNITHAEGSNLLRAEYSVDGSVVSVYFFEYSDNDLQIDLIQYQDEFISSDYYNHPGYLQWNYYLIFIRNGESVNKKLKAQIEKDDEYTRKFVFTQEEVKAYFTYKFSKQIIETDVVSKWKEKLRAVDLDEVYADTYYSEAIPRFLNDNVEKENIADQNIATPIQPSELRVDRVSSILLHDSYRTHPHPNRSFDFKTVNLICGANGSGKTSLLTSIELVLAGKSISDPSFHEPTNCISATYNEDLDLTDEYTPNDNLKYRHRDANWYSSSYQTGNELYRTFNRYNYFDSDAAYNLAFDEDKRHISKYLSAIALGPEFGRIQDRMRGFESRLAGELRTREKTIEAQNKRIEDAKKVERAVVEISDPQSLFMLFKSTAIDVGWKAAIPSGLTDEPEEFEKEILEVRVILEALEKLLQTVRVHSLAAATEILRQNESNLQKLNESVRSHREAKNRSVDSSKLITQIETELNILNRAKLYFDNPESFGLFSLEDEISDLNQRIARNQEIANAFHLVEEKQLFQSTQKLSASKERINTEISKALKDKFSANEQKEALMETLDQLKSVISEIKALGSKYLILEKDAKACPLCDTSYPTDQLAERIKKIDLETSENATIKILNDQILSLEQTIENHNAELADINEIEQVIVLLHPADIYKNYTFVQIYESLQKTKSDLLADLNAKEILLSKKHILGQKGITKEETVLFKKEFEQLFSNIGFSAESSHAFYTLFASHTKLLSNTQHQNKTDYENEQTHRADMEKLMELLEIPLNENEPGRHLQYLNATLTRVVDHFARLQPYFDFDNNDEFIDIHTKFTKLYNAYQSYRKSLADQSQLNAARESILSAQHEIDEILPIVEKINLALKVLHEILETDDEEKILGEFLKANEKDIQDIFLTLHSPKEFSNIEFNYQDKELFLYKFESEHPISINQISTGQRSALALAIFLALHRKLDKGPKLLLFDDPVAYVDDLNILSFLDYLRELVIKENRQLFFATANQKLGGLFEKKFAFLDDQFQTIPLERFD